MQPNNSIKYLPKINESICLHKDLYMNDHSSFIYNSQNKPNVQQQANG